MVDSTIAEQAGAQSLQESGEAESQTETFLPEEPTPELEVKSFRRMFGIDEQERFDPEEQRLKLVHEQELAGFRHEKNQGSGVLNEGEYRERVFRQRKSFSQRFQRMKAVRGLNKAVRRTDKGFNANQLVH